MKKISIYPVNQDLPIPITTSNHRGDTETAISRAVRKYYGETAFFEGNNATSSKTRKHGQIFKPHAGQYTSLSKLIYIDIDEI